MLFSIRIQNFQSHVDTSINLVDGVNVIVGLSDSGKSAILRAINWVCTNKPSGDGFIRYNATGPTKVTLTFSDGNTVIRCKDTKNNFYQLNDETFKAIGQSVPPAIETVLNLNELNVMSQLDGVFLLSDSPGQIAQRINDVSSLSIIDTVLKNANSDMRACSSKETQLIDNQKTIDENISALSFIDELVADVAHGENLHTSLTKLTIKLDGIGAACQAVDDNQGVLAKLPLVPSIHEVDDIYYALCEVENTRQNAKRLASTISNVRDMSQRLYALPLYPKDEELTRLSDNLNTAYQLSSRKSQLRKIITQVHQAAANVDYAYKSEVEFRAAVNLPDTCPLCGMSGGSYV